MKKTALAVMLVSLLFFSPVFFEKSVGLVEATIQPEIEYKTPPVVTINSPVNNETFSVDTVALSFTVTKPNNWLIHGGYAAQQVLKSVNYQLDGKFSGQIPVNSTLEVPFNYSLNLTNLTDGIHALRVYAYASGWVIQMNGFYEYEVPINSSSPLVYFFTSLEQSPSPTPSPEPTLQPETFPATLIFVASVGIALAAIGLLVYLKKRHR